MKLSLSLSQLSDYLNAQFKQFYPDNCPMEQMIHACQAKVIERLDLCFSHIHKKYYYSGDESVFNHLNSDHYAMFLYLMANEAYRHQYIPLAEKSFLLNKALHGIDAFYSIDLPDIFLFVHPVGTILGNARYQNYFVVYQNVTIGSDITGVYPSFGQGTVLYAKSSVIGNCQLGSNVSVGAHAFIRNKIIPKNHLVVGLFPNEQVKPHQQNNIFDFFGIESEP